MAVATHAELNVRSATEANIEQIAGVFSRSIRTIGFLPALHTIDQDFAFWRDVILVEQRVVVAEHASSIVGVSAVEAGWLNHLYVDPGRFGGGVGATLIKEVLSQATQIDLWCFQQNCRTRGFYEHHGFIAVEFTDGARNEEKTPDVHYRWIRG